MNEYAAPGTEKARTPNPRICFPALYRLDFRASKLMMARVINMDTIKIIFLKWKYNVVYLV